jgi:peptidoglycan/xylan/chitin deacetylase (PgdA/CDA1 family)
MASRRLTFDSLGLVAEHLLPRPILSTSIGASLAGLGVSLCLHRVSPTPRTTDWQHGLSIPAATLDTLVEELLTSRPGSSAHWLSLSFDDGYRDAAEYIESRAPRWPAVQFYFFVCPEKVERRAGFRWDLVEQQLIANVPKEQALQALQTPLQASTENSRADLLGLADVPSFAMATVDEVRALTRFKNVIIGNHSNTHASAANQPVSEIAVDYRRSRDDFERLFGPHTHFAFPFGTPLHHFQRHHVDLLRSLGTFTVWTTEARPYRLDEVMPKAVLPRFPVDGSKSALELATWMGLRAALFRMRGSPYQHLTV